MPTKKTTLTQVQIMRLQAMLQDEERTIVNAILVSIEGTPLYSFEITYDNGETNSRCLRLDQDLEFVLNGISISRTN